MTIGTQVRCGLFLYLAFLWGPASNARNVELGVHVTVAVHNDAGVSVGVLHQAEAEATRVFREAGLEVEWVNCGTGLGLLANPRACVSVQFPMYLQLRILPRARTLTESTFGISYLDEGGNGCYSLVFFDRVEELHRAFQQNEAVVLGHVMAHEIAHLLLGANSHSEVGIMRAHWQAEDLARAARADLHFTLEQSERMRERVANAAVKLDGTSLAAIPRRQSRSINSSWLP